jgi:nitrate reductase NapE component
MAKLLRQLALLNLAAAVAFLLPVIFWHVAENLTRGTLAFKLEPGETAEQALAKIQAATDIETLRYRAALLTKMRESDKRTRQVDADFMARTLEWILALISIASVAFVADAGFIFWMLREHNALSQAAQTSAWTKSS